MTADWSKETRLPGYPVVMTWLLVILCIVCFPTGLTRPDLACSYNNIVFHHRWWCLFTALFVHGSLGHLLGNMLFLFLFGRGLERRLGATALLFIFLVGGAGSMLFCAFYYPHDMPCVGASGAICTILATLMLFDPWKISLLLNLFPMPLGVAGFTYMLMNIAGFYNASHHATSGDLQTAYAGHLAGFVIGIVFGIILCRDWQKNLLICVLQFIGYYLLLLGIYYFFIR